MLKIVILRLCVPFPYAGPPQLFLICRVQVVNLSDAFITLSRQACSNFYMGRMVSFFCPLFMDPRMGGVVPRVP